MSENLENHTIRLLQEMHEKFDRMEARFERIESRLDGVDERLDALDTKVDGLASIWAWAAGHLTDHEYRITALEGVTPQRPPSYDQ